MTNATAGLLGSVGHFPGRHCLKPSLLRRARGVTRGPRREAVLLELRCSRRRRIESRWRLRIILLRLDSAIRTRTRGLASGARMRDGRPMGATDGSALRGPSARSNDRNHRRSRREECCRRDAYRARPSQREARKHEARSALVRGFREKVLLPLRKPALGKIPGTAGLKGQCSWFERLLDSRCSMLYMSAGGIEFSETSASAREARANGSDRYAQRKPGLLIR